MILKLVYIHQNLLRERLSLATREELYPYFSASFYENRLDEFGFLIQYLGRF